jgi:hypothetical protein
MNLTASQHQILKDYLDKELTYKETYNELYDHISSGLENTAEGCSFEQTLKTYVIREFGGTHGLHTIEKQYRATVQKGMRKRYLDYMYNLFRFPNIMLPAVLVGAVYAIFSSHWFDTKWYFALFFVASVFVNGIGAAQNIVRYFSKGAKPSVKVGGFEMVQFFPLLIFAITAIYCHFFVSAATPNMWFITLSPVVSTCILTAYGLHIISFLKMYRAEFKVDTAK